MDNRRPRRNPGQTKSGTAAFILRSVVLPAACMTLAVRPAQAGEKLPSGASIMDEYVRRSGGEEAYKGIKNRVRKTEVDSPNGVTKVMTYEAVPNRMYVESVVPRGLVRTGTNGDIAWRDGYMGPSVYTGNERDDRLLASFFHMPFKWREIYARAACTETVEIKGKKCYKVVLTPKRGTPQTRFIAVETGLPLAEERTVAVPIGNITVRLYLDDYRPVDGVLYPHRVVQTVAGQMDITIVTKSIEHNVDMPGDRFAIPPAVAALLEEK